MDSVLNEDAREFSLSLKKKLKAMEAKVLSFRNILKIESVRHPDFQNVLESYDIWFDIPECKKQSYGR